MRESLLLPNATEGHARLRQLWDALKPLLLQGQRIHVEARTETRSTEQNRLMWAMLTDIARQVDWYGQRLDADDWKDVLTAALKKERVVPGINGGFVVLGQRTSKMTRAEMSELIDLMGAFGAQRGVQWST